MNARKDYLVLAVNPGSTSTKIAVYKNHEPIAEETVHHSNEEFEGCDIFEQQKRRTAYVKKMMSDSGIAGETLDAAVGRGGVIKPIESGTYIVNEKMKKDLISDSATIHASALGGLIASEIAEQYGIPAYIVDPIVVDEMEQVAKLSGIPGIERVSIFHALNTKAVARKYRADTGRRYEDCCFVVAHMGGGISVGAHRYGRVVDVSDALLGEGPFSPERCGGVPLAPVIDMCFSGNCSREEMLRFVNKSGGMLAYLGTNDHRKVERMIRLGDEYAALVEDSMAYQVSKEIGAMAAVLEGRADAIILTGGLAHSVRFTGSIKQRVGHIAPVATYPGEDEMSAMIEGTLRVLSGAQRASVYE